MEEEKLNKKATKSEKKSILKKKEVWISAVIGIVLGIAIAYLLAFIGIPGLGNETIATFKGGKVAENYLYKEMKKNYPIGYVLQLIDKQILEDMYTLTDEQKEEIKANADSYIDMYKTYGYKEEEALNELGFESKEEFVDYLELDYRKNLCCIDYFKTLIPKEDIQNYYNDNVYGKINTKHMLAKISDDVKDEDALKLANEIIAKLNEGKSFEDVANEYGDKITFEDVNFDNFDESILASEYVEAAKTLENGAYTKSPVKTEFGYHVIYCVNKEDKPSLEDATNDIVEVLGANLEQEDQYIRYKALIKLREDKKLKFKDSKFEEEYKKYCEEINSTEEENQITDNSITVSD